MIDDMCALHANSTWELVRLSSKSIVGCCRVYAIKVGPDGQVDQLKARLIDKAHNLCELDWNDTFSPVAKMAYVCVIFYPWSLSAIGLFINRTLRMCFSMVTLRRKSIRSNHLIL